MADSVTVVLPASLSAHAGGEREVEVEAQFVRAAIDQLVTLAPDLKPHLLDSEGALQPFVNLFVDNMQVHDLDQQESPLKAGTELLIVSALAGG